MPFKLFTFLILLLISYAINAQTISLSCQLKRISTWDDRKGKSVKDGESKVFIFDDTRSLITSISKDEYYDLKKSSDLWVDIVNKNLKAKQAAEERKRENSGYGKWFEGINGPAKYYDTFGPKLDNGNIFGSVIDEPYETFMVQYSYSKTTTMLVMSGGPARGSPSSRSYYKCSELK